jgi:hypothetical protein
VNRETQPDVFEAMSDNHHSDRRLTTPTKTGWAERRRRYQHAERCRAVQLFFNRDAGNADGRQRNCDERNSIVELARRTNDVARPRPASRPDAAINTFLFTSA